MGSRAFVYRLWSADNRLYYDIVRREPAGTPNPGAFWRVISQHAVKTRFTAPKAFRAIKREDPIGEYVKQYDLSGFKYLFLAGERLDPDTYHWARKLLDRPLIDHWWQTETGWPITANCMGIEPFPVKPGSSTKPVPGFDIHILDNEGKNLGPKQTGLVTARLPLLQELYRRSGTLMKDFFSPI